MKVIPSSKFAAFWRKERVKRAWAPVSPAMWNKEGRICLQPTKSHGQLYQKKSDGKRKPRSLAPVPGSYLRRRKLWPTRQFTCSPQDMEKQAAVPHCCDKHKNPAREKLTKEHRHDSSWEQHKGSCVYKAAEVGGLILLWHVQQPHLTSSFHMVLLLDNVKR